MAGKSVPINASLTFGWETFKANALFLVGVIVAVGLMTGVVEAAAEYEVVEGGFARFVIEVISTLLEVVLEMGLIVVMLKFVADEKPEFGDLFSRIGLVFHGLIAAILALFIVAFGLLLLIVPGIYFGIRLGFLMYYIVDEGCGPLDALQKSWDLTRGSAMDLFLFYLVIFGVNLLGILALVVGLFATIPITSLMMAYMFRHLQGQGPDSEDMVASQAA